MNCALCNRPCPPPDRPYAVTQTGRIHYLDAPGYDPAKVEAVIQHLPVIHELCGRLRGLLDSHGRATAAGHGFLIRQDERLLV